LLMVNRLILTRGCFVSKSTILEGVEGRGSRAAGPMHLGGKLNGRSVLVFVTH